LQQPPGEASAVGHRLYHSGADQFVALVATHLKALGRIDDVARLGNSRGLACRRPGRTRSAEKEALQLGQQVHDEGKVVSAFLDSLESNPDHRVFVVPARDGPEMFDRFDDFSGNCYPPLAGRR